METKLVFKNYPRKRSISSKDLTQVNSTIASSRNYDLDSKTGGNYLFSCGENDVMSETQSRRSSVDLSQNFTSNDQSFLPTCVQSIVIKDKAGGVIHIKKERKEQLDRYLTCSNKP